MPKARHRDVWSNDPTCSVVRWPALDTACRHGELGALLRREGLYSSHLTDWRRQLAAEGPAGLAPKKRGPKPSPEERRVAELERDLVRTRKRLEQAEAIINAQKKLWALMTLAEQPSIGAFS